MFHLHRSHTGMAAHPPETPAGYTAIKTASNLNFQLFKIKQQRKVLVVPHVSDPGNICACDSTDTSESFSSQHLRFFYLGGPQFIY